jgi:hypothetical protein
MKEEENIPSGPELGSRERGSANFHSLSPLGDSRSSVVPVLLLPFLLCSRLSARTVLIQIDLLLVELRHDLLRRGLHDIIRARRALHAVLIRIVIDNREFATKVIERWRSCRAPLE